MHLTRYNYIMFMYGQVNTFEVFFLKNLFTISRVAKCCGISRATILRLENKGLLTPAFIDEKTGYRYYDNFNVTQILQIKKFLDIGMSYDNILLYYNSNGTSVELLQIIEEKLYNIKRAYEEIKLRIDRKSYLKFEIIDLPEYICFTRRYTGSTTDDRYRNMYNLFHEAVERGYRPLASEALFIINERTDFLKGEYTDTDVDFVCCIPLEPDYAPKDAEVYPSCKAFSCLYYGNYKNLEKIYNEFGKKIRELNLKPTGFPRALAIVAPYTGRYISEDNYVSKLVIPIEDLPDNIIKEINNSD